jgi:hypothetical protein
VPSYLVETFFPHGAEAERAAWERRARSAADELTEAGAAVSFDGSIHVPVDEHCFFLFAAATPHEAVLAARKAGLRPLRVVEAVTTRKENHR